MARTSRSVLVLAGSAQCTTCFGPRPSSSPAREGSVCKVDQQQTGQCAGEIRPRCLLERRGSGHVEILGRAALHRVSIPAIVSQGYAPPYNTPRWSGLETRETVCAAVSGQLMTNYHHTGS